MYLWCVSWFRFNFWIIRISINCYLKCEILIGLDSCLMKVNNLDNSSVWDFRIIERFLFLYKYVERVGRC